MTDRSIGSARIGLTDDLAAFIYNEVIFGYEQHYKTRVGFDIGNSEIKTVLKQHDIAIYKYDTNADAKANIEQDWQLESGNFVRFSDVHGSQAKSILRHLRNAFAHARFEVCDDSWLIHDAQGGKFTMVARMPAKALKEFTMALVHDTRPAEKNEK